MSTQFSNQSPAVVVIGAGPAGLYATEELANQGFQVALINRDIKPGGLAEYGIYKDKHKMKAGLRRQFRKILDRPNVHYFGHVTVGENDTLTLDQLQQMGFAATLVTVGAQGTKWLGLPGEELKQVYHAKDLVYHYNKLPPFSTREYPIGRRVAIIGVGNVMVDIAHWLIRDLHVDEVIAVARRGLAEVKFTKKEMQHIASNLDLEAFDAEVERIEPRMKALDQDIPAAREFVLSALKRADPAVSDSRFRFAFLSSPTKILGDDSGNVRGLEVADTELFPREDGRTGVKPTGTSRVLDVDTVVFAIGDTIDNSFGLPVKWSAFACSPDPCYPINGISFEAYDPETEQPIPQVFIAGWSREASSGLVGTARKDGVQAAQATAQFVSAQPPAANPIDAVCVLEEMLQAKGTQYVDKEKWLKLEAAEAQVAADRDLPEYKFGSDEEMLAVIRST